MKKKEKMTLISSVQAADREWHQQCFNCFECHCPIQGEFHIRVSTKNPFSFVTYLFSSLYFYDVTSKETTDGQSYFVVPVKNAFDR